MIAKNISLRKSSKACEQKKKRKKKKKIGKPNNNNNTWKGMYTVMPAPIHGLRRAHPHEHTRIEWFDDDA